MTGSRDAMKGQPTAASLMRDEHILAIDPVPGSAPEQGGWRRRVKPVPGRSLGHRALAMAQAGAAETQRRLAMGLSPGVVRGFGVTWQRMGDADTLAVESGMALTCAGEDVEIARALEVGAAELQLCLPLAALFAWRRRALGPDPVDPARLPPGLRKLPTGPLAGAGHIPDWPEWALGPRLKDLVGGPELADAPRLAVLVAEPVTLDAAFPAPSLGGPEAFAADIRDEPYDDRRLIDGCRLSLYLWPAGIVPPAGVDAPGYGLPPASDPAFRNRAAHALFSMERSFRTGDMHPWERLGAPLALIGFTADWRIAFIDRAAVVRAGGLPRSRTPLVSHSGSPFLWQARLSQFEEQRRAEDLSPTGIAELTKRFPRLPPVGSLPRSLFDPVAIRQSFFPETFAVSIAPAPLDQMEAIIRDSMSLRPLSLAEPEAVEVLLPVPASRYDPDMLEEAKVDADLEERVGALPVARESRLAQRQAARRIVDLHAVALTGRAGGWPGRDRDEAESERLRPVGCRRFRAFSGMVGHLLAAKSGAGFELSSGHIIYAWVRPSVDVLSITIGRDGAAGFAGASWKRSEGRLPTADRWVKLSFPAASILSALTPLERKIGRIESLAFLQDGAATARVLWGPCGAAQPDGFETEWIGDDPPAGLVAPPAGGTAWVWIDAGPDDLPATDVDAQGAAPGQDGRRTPSALNAFAVEAAALDASPTARIDPKVFGLDPYIRSLDGQLDKLDDLIDAAFLRSRADTVRVRQLMLGEDDAERLATSPALSDIIRKEIGASGVSVRLSEFLKDAKKNLSPITEPPVGDLRMVVSQGMIERRRLSDSLAPSLPVSRQVTSEVAAVMSAKTSVPPELIDALKSRRQLQDEIRYQAPPVNVIDRSMTVAERLRGPDSVNAWGFAVEARAALVADIAALLDGDVGLNDIVISGLVKTPAAEDTAAVLFTLGDLKTSKTEIDRELAAFPKASVGTAGLFNAAVEIIDNTVALLRQLEARVGRYRQAAKAAAAARVAVMAALRRAQAVLDAADAELSEARHDVAVGSALLAEERARVGALNNRRRETLREHVPYLLFRRRRVAERDLPLLAVEASPVDDQRPELQCRAAHDDAPPEIREMAETFRNAPAAWFPQLSSAVDLIARAEDMRAALSALAKPKPMPRLRREGAVAGLSLVLTRTIEIQTAAIAATAAAIAAVPASLVETRGLLAAQTAYRARVTVGELIEGAHGTPAAAKAAGDLLARLAQLAACLHESLDDAPARVRLGWAERVSSFDDPLPLRQLSALPGWTLLSADARREQQGLVDALHAMVNPAQPAALEAISQCVRVAVLLSAHAPVASIIAARAVRPARPVVGGMIELALDLSAVRLGMDVVMRDRNGVVARARIADVVAGMAQAAVTKVERAGVDITTATDIEIGLKLKPKPATRGFAKVLR